MNLSLGLHRLMWRAPAVSAVTVVSDASTSAAATVSTEFDVAADRPAQTDFAGGRHVLLS